jgi:hypothetical protein
MAHLCKQIKAVDEREKALQTAYKPQDSGIE